MEAHHQALAWIRTTAASFRWFHFLLRCAVGAATRRIHGNQKNASYDKNSFHVPRHQV